MSEELQIFLGDLGLTRIGKFVLLHLLLSCSKATLSYETIVLIKKNKIFFEFGLYKYFIFLLACLSITLRLFDAICKRKT